MTSAPEAAPSSGLEVGVLVARRALRGPWASHTWLPVEVLPAAPEAAAWTRLSRTETEEIYYAGSFAIELHPAETSHYRDNLRSEQPSLWVALRPIGGDDHEIATVTADPYEGESLAEGIGEIVEAVPMPPEIQAKVAAFVETFHVERAFVKRKRDRADPESLARRARGRHPQGEGGT
jgi:hypothetical protein